MKEVKEENKDIQEAKIVTVQPLQPLKVIVEFEENGKTEQAEVIIFMDQIDGKMYNMKGPVEATIQEGIENWIDKKEQEMRNKILSGVVQVSPQQLSEMGIDLKNKNEKKIII